MEKLHRGSFSKIWLIPLVAAVFAVFLIMSIQVALAHHPEIVAEAVCDTTTGVVNIEFTATAWQNVDPLRRVNNHIHIEFDSVIVAHGEFNLGNGFTFSGSAPAPVGPGPVEVKAVSVVQWGPDEDLGSQGTFRVTSVEIPEVCNIAGRMTGGGSVFNDNINRDIGVRVTRGFQIHCDTSEPNNLQVNEHGSGKLNFHMEDLTFAQCVENPAINQDPPPGTPFDTFIGYGTGRLTDGKVDLGTAFICFVFRDDGEPGKTDISAILITTVDISQTADTCRDRVFDDQLNIPWPNDGSTPPVLLNQTGLGGALVLFVNGSLKSGNSQAHGVN